MMFKKGDIITCVYAPSTKQIAINPSNYLVVGDKYTVRHTRLDPQQVLIKVPRNGNLYFYSSLFTIVPRTAKQLIQSVRGNHDV